MNSVMDILPGNKHRSPAYHRPAAASIVDTVNRFRPALLAALLLAVSLLGAANLRASVDEVQETEGLLAPTDMQRKISALARRYVGRFHYQQVSIDDSLSEKIFTEYLDSLDPSKAYLLKSDIEYFQRHKTRLDDYLRRDDISPAFEIFNIYRQRVAERIAVAQQLLHQGFDFSIDERLQIDRSEADWESDRQALDDYWRKRVKNDWLRLKLTGKEKEKIREMLAKRYNELHRRIAELDSEDVFQFYMNSFLNTVEPHTSYLSPRTSENFEIAMSLSFEGIGALLGSEGEYTIIRSIVPGGPADIDDRLQPGDRIIGVAQGRGGEMQDVIGWRIDDVVDLIRGPKDSVVLLNILPADTGLQGPAVEIDLVRNEIRLEEQAASSEILEIPDIDTDGELTSVRIGVISLPTFYLDFAAYSENLPNYRSSTRDVRKLITELKQRGIDGLVMDLRDNGGGSLLEATTMTGLFIDKGPVVQVRDNRDRVSMHADNEPGVIWNGPMAVLVNRYSASASEIFAAALQDYGRALIVGEPTYGKGTVQNLIDLDRHVAGSGQQYGQLKMTMAQFFRINGGSTQNRGVIPDIRLPTPGDADEYGESALGNALPWSKIEPASYHAKDQYQKLLPRLLEQFEQRTNQDDEFAFLQDDISEYQKHQNDQYISLLESARRQEMEQAEQRRQKRQEQRSKRQMQVKHIPVGNQNAAAENDPQLRDGINAGEDDALGLENDGRDDAPDIYLEETARIIADASLIFNQDRVLVDRDKVATLLAGKRAEDADKSVSVLTSTANTSAEPNPDSPPEG